jgi:hypothetical protein
MPLTWNIGEIEMYRDDINKAYYEREEDGQKTFDLVPITKHFIFWGGAVAMGWISSKNASEYYGRSKTIEEIVGQGFMQKWIKDKNDEWEISEVYMTMQDVKDHINLATNHSNRNLTEWIKNFVQNNKTVSPEAKTVRAMVNYHKYQYEKWQYQNNQTQKKDKVK